MHLSGTRSATPLTGARGVRDSCGHAVHHRPSPLALGRRHGGGCLWPSNQRRHRLTIATDSPGAAAVEEAAAAASPPADAYVATAAEAAAAGSTLEQIDWHKQWYPLAIIADLDPRRPHAARLLNEPLVLWRDGGGAWRAFADRCPHRLAPLSEGRVDPASGELLCSYHGWQFDGAGSCTRIPQIGDTAARASAASSARACAVPHPTRELQGVLWAWGAGGPSAEADAAAAPPPLTLDELDSPDWAPITGWYVRDVPLTMTTVMENVCDPCHARFTHHGVQGRREQEKGSVLTPEGPMSAAGFSVSQVSNGVVARFDWRTPCRLSYCFPAFGRRMEVWLTPTSNGETRMLTRFLKSATPPPTPPAAASSGAGAPGTPRPPPKRSPVAALVFKLVDRLQSIPLFEHMLRNTVLDGDNYVLHVQERELAAALDAHVAASGGGESAARSTAWREAFYMPGKSDTGVGMLHVWLERFGAKLPVLPRKLADLPPQLSRRAVFDRYEQHTKHCATCSRALVRVDAALPALRALGAALLVWAAVALARGAAVSSWAVVGAAVGAAAVAGVHRVLEGLRAQLTYVDYVHAFKD